ncbi:MAG: alpha-glucosidase [Clostridia bacterium]|nr:alpha-glucosidase [Clostridia bacterium]
MLTLASTIGELLKNPIGHDILERLTQYAGVDARFVDNPLVRRMRLSSLPKLTGGKVSPSLLDTMIRLFNQDEGLAPLPKDSGRAWWKEAVVYQIYPRSFKDSDGDGIGDLRGILEKLDYLETLGVNAVWLSPVFDSPNDDNGYDVRDYKKIMTEFGDMADMEALIEGLHARGMRIILDLVLNHTSDEHEWFLSSKSDPQGPYGDYYIWRRSESGAPNNWQSFFGGGAWNYYPERDAHALHLFSKKQMDLNWENPAVREALRDIVLFWRGKGADGFRLDVINYISKTSLEDGDETLGALLGFRGVEHYFYGERLHAYLNEMRETAFGDAFTIGETPGTGPEMNKLLTAPGRRELSTVFCFDHLENLGKNRFDDYRYDLNHLKKCFIGYEGDFAEASWPSIFVENHDNPRMLSKIDPEGRHHGVLSKLLAVLLLTARGTPFLYQGQELGAVNVDFQDIGELRDVESVNRHAELEAAGESDAWRKIKRGTRDHARTPMQWTGESGAGFSSAEPWIRVADPRGWSVEAQMDDADSTLSAYKTLIALRRAHPALVYGSFRPLYEKRRDIFCYVRADAAETLTVVANLSPGAMAHPRLEGAQERLYGNYPDAAAGLRPYEACVYRRREG